MIVATRPTSSSLRPGIACALIGLFALNLGCRHQESRDWEKTTTQQPVAHSVRQISGLPYRDKVPHQTKANRLDLYLPEDKHDFPVVVLVHGGAWVSGDNRGFGLVSGVAHLLASQGIGVVVPNYRLSPAVKHPEHIHDVAQAVAWTRKNCAEYGGDPSNLFLMGHSAGGHLVSLLATDPYYLEGAGLHSTDLRGVISVSGVYRLPNGKMDLALGGTSGRSFRLDELAPLRSEGRWFANVMSAVPQIPLKLDFFSPMFGDDPEVRWNASPINHIRHGLPPFLIIHAGKRDLPDLADGAREFHWYLRSADNEAEIIEMPNRNHNSVFFAANQKNDPTARAVSQFIQAHSRSNSASE